MSKHHNERLNFTGPGYYGALSSEDGYGGFNYVDYMEYINSDWANQQWCDNGYINVINASRGAVGCAYVDDVGLMETANLKETFSLTSMIAASNWDSNAVWDIKSYTYANGGFALKANDTLTISETATKVNFAKLGSTGDFRNIAAVVFELSSVGGGGNTCSYGSATYGYGLAFDALKVKWNGKIPAGNGNHKAFLPPGLASHHHLNAHPWAQGQHGTFHADAGVGNHNASVHHTETAYHSQLLSLFGHDASGLTAQFHLPAVEHFGT